MLVGAISISSFFSLWNLLKENFLWNDFMFFLNSVNHIRGLSVILESDIDPGYIQWNLTSIQIGEISFPRFPSMCVLCNFRKLDTLNS